jgi:Mg2+/citrate symporter
MVGIVLALEIDYPDLQMRRERIGAHAKAALVMAGALFSAGAFTGIVRESGIGIAATVEADWHFGMKSRTLVRLRKGAFSLWV